MNEEDDDNDRKELGQATLRLKVDTDAVINIDKPALTYYIAKNYNRLAMHY